MSPQRAILFFTCGAHATTHLYMLLFTAVLGPMAASFEMDVATFTQYAMISTVLFGLGAIPAGWLADRYGEKRLLVAFFVLTGAGGLIVGLAQSRLFLAAGMALLGLGTSIFHPVGNSLLAKGSPNPGRAMGINGLWGSIGTAAGPLYAGLITKWSGSWRGSYLSLFVPMMALGYWLYVTKLEEGEPLVRQPEKEADRAVGPQPRDKSLVARLTLLLMATTCGGLTFHLITTMLTRLAASGGGDGLESALLRGSVLASLIYLIGGVGQILAGNLVDRHDGRGLYVLILITAAPLIFFVGQLAGSSPLVLTSLGGVMAVAVFAVQPVENVLLSRFAPPGRRGFVFGLKFVLAFGLGGMGTGLAGVLEWKYGIATVFTVAAAVTLLAALLAVGAWKWPAKPDA
jgi:FSR family fosmidomycin resistance protein-like MFS transporter